MFRAVPLALGSPGHVIHIFCGILSFNLYKHQKNVDPGLDIMRMERRPRLSFEVVLGASRLQS